MSERPVVVLDPGHGGARGTHNRGSSWNRAEGPNGLLEKTVVFDVARRVAARLEPLARVELTRTEDANPSLAERAAVARRLDAAVFLSLHLNGSSDAEADGTDVYVAHDAGEAARAFGQSVWRHLRTATGTTRGGVGVRDFGTLLTSRLGPRTAGCLAEMAYLTNPRQARALAEEPYRDHLAEALAEAIRERLAPRVAASELGLADGSPFVADALKSCWEKCEQLRLNASNADAPNAIAARRILAETGVTVESNPYAVIGKNEIEAVIRAAFSSHAGPEVLLALWAKSGNTRSIVEPVAIPQATTDANARSILRSRIYFEDLGARHFVVRAKAGSGAGRSFDDSDAAATAHETRFAQGVAELVAGRFLGEDIAGAINAELKVSQVDGRRAVVPTTRFYALSLLLVDALWAKVKGSGHKAARGKTVRFDYYVESFKPIFADAVKLIKPGAVDHPAARASDAGVDEAPVEAFAPPPPPPVAPTFATVNRVVTKTLPGVAPFVPMPIIFEETHGPFGAATLTTREVATEAALRAELPGFSLEQTSSTQTKLPPSAALPTGFIGPLILKADRSENIDKFTGSPFFRFTGGNVEVALDSIICFPADPAHPAQLPPGGGRFPIAIIVHGNHAAAEKPTRIPTGGPVQVITLPKTPPALPNGGSVEIRPVRLTYKAIDSHLGYCQVAPPTVEHHLAFGGTPYLQEALAGIGIVSMSVSTNGANHLFPLVPDITFRAAYVMQYLDQLRRLDAAPGGMFQNRLDFNRVALIGHSRGGDAVVRAIEFNAKRPVARRGDATAEGRQCTIRAVVTISPTDLSGVLNPTGTGARPAVIAEPIRYLCVYGSHDGDIRGGGDGAHDGVASGFRIYDRAVTAERAMVFIHGANHNRFNRVWEDEQDATPPPATMTRAKQESLASDYITAWLRYGLYEDPRQLGLLSGSMPKPQGADASLIWTFGLRKEIETHQDTDAAHNTLAGGVSVPPYVSEVTLDSENPADPFLPGFHLPTFPHVHRVGKAGPVTGTRGPVRELIPPRHADFTPFTHLTFRITKRYPTADQTAINTAPFPNFTITLEDAAKTIHRHTISNTDILNANPRRVKPYHRVLEDSADPRRNITKCNLETWRVPLSLFKASAPVVELNLVHAIEFDFDALPNQPIYIDGITLVNIS